ncbi:hypothetical protein QUB61_39890 [Microcoleus sp. C2D2]
MKKNLFISVIISSFFIVALPAKAVETRCGWLHNPIPGNINSGYTGMMGSRPLGVGSRGMWNY